MDLMAGGGELHAQYAEPGKLAARQSIWQYVPGPTLAQRVIDLVPPRAAVVDIGCGNGVYLEGLRRRGVNPRVIGFDLFDGMARAARVHAHTAVADIATLPIRDGAADIALCLHMLYHVPDIAGAGRELRRVVRPGGLVLITTNGTGHTAELKQAMDTAARRIAGTQVDPDWDTRRFGTDTAAVLLDELFDDVVVMPAGGVAAVDDPAVLAAYLASWPPGAAGLTDGPMWTEAVAEAGRIIRAHIAEHGVFPVTSRAAILVARLRD